MRLDTGGCVLHRQGSKASLIAITAESRGGATEYSTPRHASKDRAEALRTQLSLNRLAQQVRDRVPLRCI